VCIDPRIHQSKGNHRQHELKSTLARYKLTVNLVFVNSYIHPLGTELVNSFAFSHEHDLQLASFRVVVDELSKLLVYRVILHGNVNCDSLFELDDVVLESFNFDLCVLELLQKFKGCLIGFVSLLLLLKQVITGSFKVLLESSFLLIKLGDDLIGCVQLPVHVLEPL
jgi:hypothetical protein